MKTRVCFRYPAVDLPANNRVTTVTPKPNRFQRDLSYCNSGISYLLTPSIARSTLSLISSQWKKIGSLLIVYRILSLSATEFFSTITVANPLT